MWRLRRKWKVASAAGCTLTRGLWTGGLVRTSWEPGHVVAGSPLRWVSTEVTIILSCASCQLSGPLQNLLRPWLA